MANLIFKRSLHHKLLDNWNQLSQSEKEAYLAQVDQALQAVGGKRVVLIVCTSAHALENWDTLGLEIFPDAQALEKHQELLDQLDWNDHIKIDETIGTTKDLQGWLETTLQE